MLCSEDIRQNQSSKHHLLRLKGVPSADKGAVQNKIINTFSFKCDARMKYLNTSLYEHFSATFCILMCLTYCRKKVLFQKEISNALWYFRVLRVKYCVCRWQPGTMHYTRNMALFTMPLQALIPHRRNIFASMHILQLNTPPATENAKHLQYIGHNVLLCFYRIC